MIAVDSSRDNVSGSSCTGRIDTRQRPLLDSRTSRSTPRPSHMTTARPHHRPDKYSDRSVRGPTPLTAVTTLLAGSIVLACLLSLTGCRLLKDSSDTTLEKIGLRLQPLGAGRNVICLEFISVKRPANDPLLGDLLWNRLDTIGRRPAEMRAALAAGGFRVGQVGASPPAPLETLLGLTAPEYDDRLATNRSAHKNLNGWRVFLRDQGETEVVLHDAPLSAHQLARAGIAPNTELHNARYLLKIRVRQLREGWIRLECLPEVHHGRQRLQPTATEAGWGLRTRQDVVPLYDLKFTVDLTEGEMAVVTSTPDATNPSIGHRFFSTDDGRTQLIVARLARVPNKNPLPTRIAAETGRDTGR